MVALALTLGTFALAACGGSDDSKSGSAMTSGVTNESSEAVREEIVIKAHASPRVVRQPSADDDTRDTGSTEFRTGGTRPRIVWSLSLTRR
jgi:hypothetical protein